MMEYRERKEAVKCCYLRRSNSGHYLNGQSTLGFVCENPKVFGKFVQAQFESLDMCCVCKHHEKRVKNE